MSKPVLHLAACLAFTLCAGSVLAQTSPQTSTSGTVSHNTGVAKPPANAPLPKPKPKHDKNSGIGVNVPTTPQIALHPQATIGSNVPMAGPGGTTATGTGN
ncbi:hypothetical protein [Acidocella sp.]|uniref:hypothetical protein n=1 Tax=Acidocella sp. TaxID=50710 RepID=UPI0026353244|nr:hypothetical protein [Acidocella sp.]